MVLCYFLRRTKHFTVRGSTFGVLIIGGSLDTAMLWQHFCILRPDLSRLLGGYLITHELIQHGGAAVGGVVFMVSEDKQQAPYTCCEIC